MSASNPVERARDRVGLNPRPTLKRSQEHTHGSTVTAKDELEGRGLLSHFVYLDLSREEKGKNRLF